MAAVGKPGRGTRELGRVSELLGSVMSVPVSAGLSTPKSPSPAARACRDSVWGFILLHSCEAQQHADRITALVGRMEQCTQSEERHAAEGDLRLGLDPQDLTWPTISNTHRIIIAFNDSELLVSELAYRVDIVRSRLSRRARVAEPRSAGRVDARRRSRRLGADSRCASAPGPAPRRTGWIALE